LTQSHRKNSHDVKSVLEHIIPFALDCLSTTLEVVIKVSTYSKSKCGGSPSCMKSSFPTFIHSEMVGHTKFWNISELSSLFFKTENIDVFTAVRTSVISEYHYPFMENL
jgi:hypothetical protein